MIEFSSIVALNPWDIDPRTRAEMERIQSELQFTEFDGGSPTEPPLDWYQPLSEPIFEQHHVIYEPTVEPIA